MRIFIDARLYGSGHTGIGRYSQNLIDNLIDINKIHDLILLTHQNASISSKSNLTVIKTSIGHYGFSEQFKLLELISSHNPDLVHFTHFNHPVLYNKPFVVTIHDLIKSDYKDYSSSTRTKTYYEIKHFFYQKVIKHAVFKSRAIITPSNFSKTRIISHFPNVDKKKINVIYEGVDEFKQISTKKILDQNNYSKYGNYCLYVGNSYPYKNLKLVIEAIKQIPQLNLVVVSKSSKDLDLIKANTQHNNQFIFLENVTDAELSSLYKYSKFFIFPSKSEGFGIPGLEAMAMSTPVISSNAGPMPEIYGSAALYFDPDNVDDLTKVVNNLLLNYQSEYIRLTRLGKSQIKKYSWLRMAKDTLKIYENCLSL